MTAQYSENLPTVFQPKVYSLPPLILHPFAEPAEPHKVTESARASLVIQGLLPPGDANPQALQRSLLDGRFSELRMLYYVGKDVQRWMEQCVDFVHAGERSVEAGIVPQSFASLLIQHTPEAVAAKLKKWGVNDFRSIFSRGLGLNAMFAEVPSRESLSDDFVRNYFRYADQLFFAYLSQAVYTQLKPNQFQFELYSSGEFSRMLERQWA